MNYSALELKQLYSQMVLIRLFEQKTIEIFAARMKVKDFPGALHSSEGQEAVAVGVFSVLRPDDYAFSTYRGHGHAIAKGLDLNRVMAEVHGRASGVSRGFGGSMHLFDRERNFMGGNGIVSGGLPLALGTACASVLQNDGRVTVAFFGDGGASQGSFHESLNMAAIMKWPIIFCCENNQYAATTHVSMNCPIPNIADRATAYGIPGVVVDGNDVRSVAKATLAAADRGREGLGPTLLECKTYRHRAHCMVIPEHRLSREREEWKQQDPIDKLGRQLVAEGVATKQELDNIEAERIADIAAAVRFTEQSPLPDPAAIDEAIFA